MQKLTTTRLLIFALRLIALALAFMCISFASLGDWPRAVRAFGSGVVTLLTAQSVLQPTSRALQLSTVAMAALVLAGHFWWFGLR